MEEQTFVDAHGVDVFTRWWSIDDPRALVLVSHGASEHCGRYDRFARALNDAGIAVVALDHRGHGRTNEAPGPAVMGPGGGQAVVDDLHELRAAASSRFDDDVPVHLFGHSMGSLVALAYVTQHGEGLASTVLCGFPLDLEKADDRAGAVREAAAGGRRDEPVAARPRGEGAAATRTAYDWLSRDEAEVDRYIADPMCGTGNPLTYGYLADLYDVVLPATRRLAEIPCPVLVIAGDQDPAAGMGAHPTALTEALRREGRDVELRLYDGARHELLNELERDEVTADLVRWFDRHRPADAR